MYVSVICDALLTHIINTFNYNKDVVNIRLYIFVCKNHTFETG